MRKKNCSRPPKKGKGMGITNEGMMEKPPKPKPPKGDRGGAMAGAPTTVVLFTTVRFLRLHAGKRALRLL